MVGNEPIFVLFSLVVHIDLNVADDRLDLTLQAPALHLVVLLPDDHNQNLAREEKHNDGVVDDEDDAPVWY